MSEQSLISVVIPAFNASGVIGETLESVRSQTFQDFEVVIVDDGSTDNTAAVVRKFCETDARFKLIQQTNHGVSTARNHAIHEACGEWIAFLDADDVWLPQKLERQLELVRQYPNANLFFTNCFLWDGHRDLRVWYGETWPLPHGDVTQKLIANICHACVAAMSVAMVRREIFSSVGLFDPEIRICEDWDLLLRMAESYLWVAGTDEPLVRYRRWSGNTTADDVMLLEATIGVLEKNLRRTRRLDLRPLYQNSLSQRRIRLKAARSKREIARAGELLESSPEKIPVAIWRAWRFSPRRTKWLLWFLLITWPKFLGGATTRRIVHRKLKKIRKRK